MTVKTTLSTLNNGEIEEKFQLALKQVLNNLADENTSHRATRKISVEILMSANEERNRISIGTQVKTTLAPIRSSETVAWMTNNNNNLELMEEIFEEKNLFFDDEVKNKIQIKGAISC